MANKQSGSPRKNLNIKQISTKIVANVAKGEIFILQSSAELTREKTNRDS